MISEDDESDPTGLLSILGKPSKLYPVSSETEELILICEGLPASKRAEVADFARFLAARQEDDRWETLLAHPERRPKLDAFLRESAAEGEAALDVSRL